MSIPLSFSLSSLSDSFFPSDEVISTRLWRAHYTRPKNHLLIKTLDHSINVQHYLIWHCSDWVDEPSWVLAVVLFDFMKMLHIWESFTASALKTGVPGAPERPFKVSRCLNAKRHRLDQVFGSPSDSEPAFRRLMSVRSITLDVSYALVLASLLSLVPLFSCSAPSSACSHVTVMAKWRESGVWEVWGCGSSTLFTINARPRLVLTSQMGDLQWYCSPASLA